MPKQIFQRPVPVRHDHWTKKDKSGPPVQRTTKLTPKPPVPEPEKPGALPGSAVKLPK